MHHISLSHTFAELLKKIAWGVSSVGSEHLPYKQGVTGSSPVLPTSKRRTYTAMCKSFLILLEGIQKLIFFSQLDYMKRDSRIASHVIDLLKNSLIRQDHEFLCIDSF